MTSSSDLASLIDHTLLKSDATGDDIDLICDEAKGWGFKTVCVTPKYVNRCAKYLSGTRVGITTVVGFPLGTSTTMKKIATVKKGLDDGATEFDMVMNIRAFKDGDLSSVRQDIESVVEVAQSKIIKVIIETCLLSDYEKVSAAKTVQVSGADFVKTSTGFSKEGANVFDIKLIRQSVGQEFGIKASGGIKTYKQANLMVNAGANRLGSSSASFLMQKNR